MNRLRGQRCYLVGAIDKCPDRGVTWRDEIGAELKKRGVKVFNPLTKPVIGSVENLSLLPERRIQKALANYEYVRREMKAIRHEDLRTCDRADFAVVYFDMDVQPCGTFEELFTLNRSKKPCLVLCKQGVSELYDWLFGVLPLKHLFGTKKDLLSYLDWVDSGEDFADDTDRWIFWDEEWEEHAWIDKVVEFLSGRFCDDCDGTFSRGHLLDEYERIYGKASC